MFQYTEKIAYVKTNLRKYLYWNTWSAVPVYWVTLLFVLGEML